MRPLLSAYPIHRASESETACRSSELVCCGVPDNGPRGGAPATGRSGAARNAATRDLAAAAVHGHRALAQHERAGAHLPYDVRTRLEQAAPESLPVPSGRCAPLTYAEDGTVVAAVKLQELFGLADTPVLGPGRVPVTFSLLAPNGRAVQTTRDLRSFWQGAYQEVRRELRGRYPKHPWPEDPWTAVPTHRTTRALGKTPPAR